MHRQLFGLLHTDETGVPVTTFVDFTSITSSKKSRNVRNSHMGTAKGSIGWLGGRTDLSSQPLDGQFVGLMGSTCHEEKWAPLKLFRPALS